MLKRTIFCADEEVFEQWIKKLKKNEPMDDTKISLNSSYQFLLKKQTKNTKKQIDFKNFPRTRINNFEKRLCDALKNNSTLKTASSYFLSILKTKNNQIDKFEKFVIDVSPICLNLWQKLSKRIQLLNA